jgi:serine protease
MLQGALAAGPLRAAAVSLFVSLGMAGAALAAPAGASAASTAPAYSNGHAYRHGAVPRRGLQHTKAFNAPGTPAASANNLNYGGGISGVGVTTGAERVYLVFWGSQWGTQSTNSSGYATFSGDPKSVAPDVQAFFTGLGNGGETWSGVMTQYCQGLAVGTQTCPAGNTSHVGYPTGGALAGVWEDTSSAAPSAASAHHLGQEAENAATHFGNTTTASNRSTQYVIVSPTGANPDNYKTQGFCAWHDYSGDSTMDGGGAVSGSLVAFTNLPYIPDAGASCGQNFVNSGSAGTLDGVTIVEGHEYAETVTDQFPAGGWTDSTGAENGDKCAWISSGQGKSQNVALTTGSFAVQSTWANDFNGGAGGCEVSHPIVNNGGGGNTVTVTSPGNQTSTVGTPVSLQIQASDSASGQTLSYSASGLPAGLSINSSSGLISGTPTTAGTSSVTVTASDTTGASGSASFTWTVSSSSGACTAEQLLGNPGFETGSASPWNASAGVINANGAGETAHSGSWYAWLDGYGRRHTDTLAQTVAIGAGCHTDTFSFWLRIDTSEATSAAVDTLKAQVLNSAGTVLATLATYSNLNAGGYVQKTFNVSAYAGQTIKVKFTGVETDKGGGTTSFVIDDAALNQSS